MMQEQTYQQNAFGANGKRQCDIRILNPIAKSYLNQSQAHAAHKNNEEEKKRKHSK